MINWVKSNEESFEYGLNVLPPAANTPSYDAFLVGEPFDSDEEGRHTFTAHCRRHGEFFRSEKAISFKVFKSEFPDARYWYGR